MKEILTLIAFTGMLTSASFASNSDNEDSFKTGKGKVDMKFLGHASLLFKFGSKTIYIDPSSAYANLKNMPKADLIIITHEHFDHFEPKVISALKKESCVVIATEQCREASPTIVMRNGDTKIVDGIKIEAVPAYNLIHKNEKGDLYHPKGRGNGYILTLEKFRIYIAGDTENIPEMTSLKNIDVAFMPMNLPYTMDEAMFIQAAKMVNPKILFPYHYKGSDLHRVKETLSRETKIDVRLKKFY